MGPNGSGPEVKLLKVWTFSFLGDAMSFIFLPDASSSTTPENAMPRQQAPCARQGCDELWSTLRCRRCRAVRYCSAACAKENWPEHKLSCVDAGGQGDGSAAPTTGAIAKQKAPSK